MGAALALAMPPNRRRENHLAVQTQIGGLVLHEAHLHSHVLEPLVQESLHVWARAFDGGLEHAQHFVVKAQGGVELHEVAPYAREAAARGPQPHCWHLRGGAGGLHARSPRPGRVPPLCHHVLPGEAAGQLGVDVGGQGLAHHQVGEGVHAHVRRSDALQHVVPPQVQRVVPHVRLVLQLRSATIDGARIEEARRLRFHLGSPAGVEVLGSGGPLSPC
mmetsp:Transcript_32350/g.62187  ORF Transcript_32350/g.62187 Transcript_32350/m.62187 type:complete len:218 (+) Transcript_32350:794-1447(+)